MRAWRVANARLQDMLSRHRVDITIMLRALVHRGLLVPEGMGRGTHYTLGAPMANPMGGGPPICPTAPSFAR
jgi:ATP-dependent DNA helicase RecG